MDQPSSSAKVIDDPYIRADGKIGFVCLLLFTSILIVLNMSRLFDNNFWSDEIYSINVAHMGFNDIIDYAMNVDSHPPLYNLYMSLLCHIFGFQPFTYHLTSFIAYLGIIAVGLTFVRKKWGCISSAAFIILATLLNSSSYFIPEARMYELGSLFVLLSFISLYGVLKDGSKRHYIFFVITSLAAAYTHYYCLLAVAFFYVFLIIYYISKHQWQSFKRFFLFGIITVLGYIPWMLTSLFKTIEKDTGSFWIESTVSILQCFEYLFSHNFSFIILLIFVASIIALFVRNNERLEKYNDSNAGIESMWALAGLLSIFGSIIFGQCLSALTTPLVIVRYLYPVSILAWLLFAVSFRHLDSIKFTKKKATTVIIVVLIVLCLPGYCVNLNEEFNNNQSTLNIIDCVNDNTEDGDIIVTDMNHMNKTMGKYYYPNLKTVYFEENKLPELDHNKHHILYLYEETKISDLDKQLHDQGYTAEKLISGSFASAYKVCVYDLKAIA